MLPDETVASSVSFLIPLTEKCRSPASIHLGILQLSGPMAKTGAAIASSGLFVI
jgi:hypothetical protein